MLQWATGASPSPTAKVASVVMMMMVVAVVIVVTPPVMAPSVIAAMMVHVFMLGRRLAWRHGFRGTGQGAEEHGRPQHGAGQKCFQHVVFLSGSYFASCTKWGEIGSRAWSRRFRRRLF